MTSVLIVSNEDGDVIGVVSTTDVRADTDALADLGLAADAHVLLTVDEFVASAREQDDAS